jgi:hypothetical protein
MGAALDLLEAGQEEAEAHEHLRRGCPWFRHVTEGGGDADADGIGRHCPSSGRPAGSGRALVKFAADGVDWVALTPETPEASTVDKPTVPPGGPGLFHVKGLHLPPYVQHLWFHLAAKYGKHKAYGMAVGIVKKWAAGINPGGKHPTRTHPDVRAAAAKNVAEWESDRAKAHAQSASHGHGDDDKVKAAVALASQPARPFPGQAVIQLPPVPRNKAAKAMYTAHRVNDMLVHLAHAAERLTEARRSKALRGYHMIHVNNHLSSSLDNGHNLVDAVRRNYPAEARELAALNKTLGLAEAASPDVSVATFAHLLQTILYHLAHAKRHAEVMLGPGPDPVWAFNYEHAATHAKGAMEHCFKLARHLQDNYPEEAKWLTQLVDAEDPDTDFTGLAALPPGAPGVRPPNVMPTTGPQTPRPPQMPVPTPAEVRALLSQIPPCADESLARSARNHLETAAVKLEHHTPLEALAMLRASQGDIYSAHKADLASLPPSAWTAAVIPNELSSATSAMRESRDRVLAWRRLDLAVAALADRIRKNFFHGIFAGPVPQMRLSVDYTGVTSAAVDRLAALAQGAVTGKDVSFPATTDATAQTPLLQPPEDLAVTGDAASELAGLPAIDRVRVDSYMTRAKAMRDTNPGGAAQFLARAAVIAGESGAHHLARHLRQHIQALAEGRNNTHTQGDADRMPSQSRNSPDSPSGANAQLSAVDRLLGLAAAGSSAGSSAGAAKSKASTSSGATAAEHHGLDPHQLHVLHREHLAHLERLHSEHLKHLEHLGR